MAIATHFHPQRTHWPKADKARIVCFLQLQTHKNGQSSPWTLKMPMCTNRPFIRSLFVCVNLTTAGTGFHIAKQRIPSWKLTGWNYGWKRLFTSPISDLRQQGYTATHVDPCLFNRTKGKHCIFLLITVDYFIVVASDQALIKSF